MARTIECFYPGDSFPAISITGGDCSLNCKHCGKKYLHGMVPAKTPDILLEIADVLVKRGASGFLISGGADASGKVRIADFADAIKEIKASTDLRVNAHIGLSSSQEIVRLVESGIDSFSIDVYGSNETIREVLGLDAEVRDYLNVLEDLQKAGAKLVAPHICVGIHGGRLKGEFDAVKALKPYAPNALVLISLIPTKGTEYQDSPAPTSEDLLSVVRHAREALPQTKLLLGCMRSKLDRSREFDVVAAGLDGIVLPANSTVERLAAEGYKIRKRSVCCSLF